MSQKTVTQFTGDGNYRSALTQLVDLSGSGAGPFVPVHAELGGDYESVAAGQTDQICGNTGQIGDFLDFVQIIPLTTAPGAVTFKDGDEEYPLFAGGAVSELRPIVLPIRALSRNGAWKITTGANVAVWAVGRFS